MFINIVNLTRSNAKAMLFVTNRIPYLLDLLNSFSNSFIDFYSCEVVSSSDIIKNERSIYGGCFETLNLLLVSSCEMSTLIL